MTENRYGEGVKVRISEVGEWEKKDWNIVSVLERARREKRIGGEREKEREEREIKREGMSGVEPGADLRGAL